MGGALSITGLGLYYQGDPTGQNREPPFLVKAVGTDHWQVCVSTETKMVHIIAECLDKQEAQIILDYLLNKKLEHEFTKRK